MVPVLLALMSGIVDYGWYLSRHQQVVFATRDAVRAGSMVTKDGDPVAEVEGRLGEALIQQGFEGIAYVTARRHGSTPDELILVEVEVGTEPLIGLLPFPQFYSVALSARLEHQQDPEDLL